MKVGPWTLCEGGTGAYRAILGLDGENINYRVAFIEKTPRIRIRNVYGCSPKDDHLNWASRGWKGEGPEDQESRDWCDKVLELFGYELTD